MGSDSIMYFQWRASKKGAEKYHSGMIPHYGENARVFKEICILGKELKRIKNITGSTVNSKVAILMDNDSWWTIDNPYGKGNKSLDNEIFWAANSQPFPSVLISYFSELKYYFNAFYDLNIPVDIIPLNFEFSKYKIVIAPLLHIVKPGFKEAVENFVKNGGIFINTFFSGVIDQYAGVFLNGYPGPLKNVLGLEVEEYDPLPPEGENVIKMAGEISDNFHSRWGRRRPFIVGGALMMGLLFGLIWMVPGSWNQTMQIIYFIMMQILFYTCYTVFAVPFKALTYEMTPDYNERNRVMAYVAFFHKLAEFLYEWMIPLAAVISSAYFVSKIPEGEKVEMTGIIIVTWLVGIVIMSGIGVIPGLFVRERFQKKTEHQEKVKLISSSKDAFRSRAFQILVSIIILNTLAGILASNIDHFVMIYYMADGDIAQGSIWKGLLSSGYAVVGFAFIPIITWLADKFGKRGALFFIYSLTVFGSIMK